MILAFTGTRRGLTLAQLAALPRVLTALPATVLHGGAIGADTEFHEWLREVVNKLPTEAAPAGFDVIQSVAPYAIKPNRCRVIVHPARAANAEAWAQRASRDSLITSIEPCPLGDDPELTGNRAMIARCDRLLACPAEPQEVLRSGTWATVRYARRVGRTITLLLPDGTVS